MRVWVYIDGFNLYNGLLKGTTHNWLDLLAFTRALLPRDQVERLKYFTAPVDARENDPDQPIRQRIYWRALATLGCIEVIEGQFLTKAVFMPEAASVETIRSDAARGLAVTGRRPNMVRVVRSEEKGTDVNLAVHLVHDAHLGRYEGAVVLSNDSDLAEAIRIVQDEVHKPVGILNPCRRPSALLRSRAQLFFRSIHPSVLPRCQFPDSLADAPGTFSKPRGW